MKHGGKNAPKQSMKIIETPSLFEPPLHTLSTLITCFTRPLMSLG